MKFKRKRKNDLSSYNFDKDALNVTARMILILDFLTIFVYEFALPETPLVITANQIAFFFLCHTIIVLNEKMKNRRILALILIGYIQFVLMPVFIIFGAQTQSTSPIWFAASIMVAIYLLHLHDLWWMFILSIYCATYIYAYVFIWHPSDMVIHDRFGFFLGFAFSFLAVCTGIAYICIRIENNFKAAEAEVDRCHDIVMNAGNAKARFLANMSHEIRTPMNSIIGFSELILKDELEGPIREEVSIIRKSSYELLEIIDDVLMYSKLDSGKVNISNVEFEFSTILDNIKNTLANCNINPNVDVRINLNHNIPKKVIGDDIRIKQVITRLIFISSRMTENGRLMFVINSKRNDDNTKVKFSVMIADTGCGLSEVDMGAIYGTFNTYDSRQSSDLKGIGLKFSICRKIMELMGGSLELRTIQGVGLESLLEFECDIADATPIAELESTQDKRVLIYINQPKELFFWKNDMEGFKLRIDYVNSLYLFDKALQSTDYQYIFIPNEAYLSLSSLIETYKCQDYTYIIANPNSSYGDFGKCRLIRTPVTCLSFVPVFNDEWNVEEYLSKEAETEYDGSLAKILVVDDNSVNLKVAAGIFKSLKINVDTAKSGEEALSMMEKKEYHMVFLDMVMPELSGTETLNRMRLSKIDYMVKVPVVALTASTGDNLREEILEQGFVEYLAKPIRPRYLIRMLNDFLPDGILQKKIVMKSEDSSNNMNSDIDEYTNKLKEAVNSLDLNLLKKLLTEYKDMHLKGPVLIKMNEIDNAFSMYDFKKIGEVLSTL